MPSTNSHENPGNSKFELWLSHFPQADNNLNDDVYLWEAGSPGTAHHSLLDYIEEHSDLLRSRYLAFIHDLGEYHLSGKRVVEHLSVGQGYNLWWMSLLAGKNRLNSPRITDCIKLLAVEHLLKVTKPAAVVVYGNDRRLVQCLRILCRNLEINFNHEMLVTSNGNENIWRSLRNRRPEFLSTMLWLLRYTVSHRSFFRAQPPDWNSGENAVIFFSKFFNFDREKAEQNKFYSYYWEILPGLFHGNGLTVNWLHVFRKGPLVKNARAGLAFTETFTFDSPDNDRHAFFESYLSIFRLSKAIIRYIKLLLKSLFWHEARHAFRPRESAIDFWPLLKKEWYVTTRGALALSNLIFIELADAALSAMPRQKLGLYIQENHFWEMALLHAWRLHGHGRIIGVPPTTVNYWDLIYFNDVRTVMSSDSYSQKQPDLVALNGDVAVEQYLTAGYPESRIAETEALKYLYLSEHQCGSKYGSRNPVTVKSRINSIREVIVFGDYVESLTMDMLELIGKAIDDSLSVRLTFKAHPGFQKEIPESLIKNFNITDRPVSELLPGFDLAIMSGSTSTAIEACLAGIDMIVCLGRCELNVSPVRGMPGVRFIRTHTELRDALLHQYSGKRETSKYSFFWLDKHIPRWRRLLHESGYSQFSDISTVAN